jgi:hypothetical protein
MSSVRQTIDLLKATWTQPGEAFHRGKECPFLLACTFALEPADDLSHLTIKLPRDVSEFWQITRNAALFKDQQFGQWGMEILDPDRALRETSKQTSLRPKDFVDSDLVLARFYGDSDLVVIFCDQGNTDFGSVAIASPLDNRSEWTIAATSLGEFLNRLMLAQGDKYWEV